MNPFTFLAVSDRSIASRDTLRLTRIVHKHSRSIILPLRRSLSGIRAVSVTIRCSDTQSVERSPNRATGCATIDVHIPDKPHSHLYTTILSASIRFYGLRTSNPWPVIEETFTDSRAELVPMLVGLSLLHARLWTHSFDMSSTCFHFPNLCIHLLCPVCFISYLPDFTSLTLLHAL